MTTILMGRVNGGTILQIIQMYIRNQSNSQNDYTMRT